jgi:hypothetical protein
VCVSLLWLYVSGSVYFVSMCGLVVDVCVGVCSDVIFVVLEFLIPFFFLI